jgi:hypothetical protein
MDKLLEFQLTYRLTDIVFDKNKYKTAHVLLEDEEHQLILRFVKSNRYFSNNGCSCQLLLIKIDKKNQLDVLFKQTNCSIDTIELMKNIKNIAALPEKLSDKTFSNHSFNKLFEKAVTDQKHQESKLIKPSNAKEKMFAIKERQIFANPKMWKYQLIDS